MQSLIDARPNLKSRRIAAHDMKDTGLHVILRIFVRSTQAFLYMSLNCERVDIHLSVSVLCVQRCGG